MPSASRELGALLCFQQALAAVETPQQVAQALVAAFEASGTPELIVGLLAAPTATAEGVLLVRANDPAATPQIEPWTPPDGVDSWPEDAWREFGLSLLGTRTSSAQASGSDRSVVLQFAGAPRGILIFDSPVSAPEAMRMAALTNEAVLALARLDALRRQQATQAELAEADALNARLRKRMMLSESLATIGELVSSVAHELNNPLTGVIGYAQLLQAADVSEEIKADLRTISYEASRCQEIAQSLLNLARQREQRLDSIDLNDLIQRTLKLKTYALRADNIRVEVELPYDLPRVLTDPSRLQQVLLNLINNAQEAMANTHEGGSLSIGARLIKTGPQRLVRMLVTDDGPGIPSDARPHIFEPFFTTKSDNGGTGLGLTISREIMAELGGTLELDADHAGGARFIIDLPFEGSRQGTSLLADADENALPQTTILVVDDEHDLIDLLQRALKGLGYSVDTALDGQQALQKIDQRDYDIILLDVRMPEYDGRDVYRVLETTFPHLTRRVVFTTGDLVSPETRKWLLSTGCAILEKPFDISGLAAAMQQAADRVHPS